MVIETAAGDSVSAVSDQDGRFEASVAAGAIRVIPQPVEGQLGTPSPIEVEVEGGSLDLGELAYDTGIR